MVNLPAITSLDLRCPGGSESHRHQPWGWSKEVGFLTGEEAEYPDELCQDIASLAAAHHGVSPPPSASAGGEGMDPAQHPCVGVHRQLCGRSLRQLIPEHKGIFHLTVPGSERAFVEAWAKAKSKRHTAERAVAGCHLLITR